MARYTQADLDALYALRLRFKRGEVAQSVSVSLGTGSRSVTYTPTSIGALDDMIREVGEYLGLSVARRSHTLRTRKW